MQSPVSRPHSLQPAWYSSLLESVDAQYPDIASEGVVATASRSKAIDVHVNAEISARLAIAIGYQQQDVRLASKDVLTNEIGSAPNGGTAVLCEVRFLGKWRAFDAANSFIITAICGRYCFSASRIYPNCRKASV